MLLNWSRFGVVGQLQGKLKADERIFDNKKLLNGAIEMSFYDSMIL